MDLCMTSISRLKKTSLSQSSLWSELEDTALLNTSTLEVQGQARRTVNQLSMMVDNALNRTLFLKVSDCNPSETAIDLESLNEDALGDESEGWCFLEDTIIGGLVQGDGVLCLVLNFSL
jgi:hypothetical protein